MDSFDPMQKTKEEYQQTIEHISLPNSPVGIDAQLTHAIVIDYLQNISKRLEKIESTLKIKNS